MEFNHLIESDMTYSEHFKRSMYISGTLLSAAMKNVVHAIYPDTFTTSASEAVEELYKFLFPKEVEMTNADVRTTTEELP